MDDQQILSGLRAGDSGALSAAIERYTPYVSAVIANQLRRRGRREDLEELTANVFVALWEKRGSLRTERLRGWLGAVARNQARSFLRKNRLLTVSPEDVLLISSDVAQKLLEKEEARRLLREAVEAMEPPDREIFLRFYYYEQSIPEIARDMKLQREAVKSRLRRGRDKLRARLEEGGFPYGV